MLPALFDVIDVEAAALLVVGREGDREQAALAAVVATSERMSRNGRREPVAAAQDHDPARLLDHEEQLRVARRAGDVDRVVEPADPLQRQLARPCGLRGRAPPSRAGRAAGRQQEPQAQDSASEASSRARRGRIALTLARAYPPAPCAGRRLPPGISTISPLSLTSVSGSLGRDLGDEGAAGGDAAGGLRLGFGAEAGADPVERAVYLPGLTALSFQTASAVSPGFSGPKAKVLRFEVSAPPGCAEPARRG